MRQLGPLSQFRGASLLVQFTSAQRHEALGVGGQQPLRLPQLPDGHVVVFSYLIGSGERLVRCETLEDMIACQKMASVPQVRGTRWYTLDTSRMPVA